MTDVGNGSPRGPRAKGLTGDTVGGMRRFAILGFVISVLLGLASRKLGPRGFALWDKRFGDAVYAAMVGFLLLARRPTLSPRAVGLGAFGI